MPPKFLFARWLELKTGFLLSLGLFEIAVNLTRPNRKLPIPHSRLKMISKTDTNGDTAALKKRKREPKEDSVLPQQQQKKHRRKSKSKLNGEEEADIEDQGANGDTAALQQVDGDVALPDAASQALDGPGEDAPAAWKVQNPMGGRMLDIDPIFSVDER